MNTMIDAGLPGVSVVVAVRNEALYIDRCVESLLTQDYPRDKLEFIFVDGCSGDETVKRLRIWQAKDDRISILQNDLKITSAGMNLGMEASNFAYLLWVSGHSILESSHIRQCVETSKKHEAAAVGGILHTRGVTTLGQINAAVLSHPFGVGGGEHRVGRESGWVFAVTMALYRKTALQAVGGWDESLPRNQDNDLHARLGKAGYRSYLNSRINPTYFCRDTLAGLLQQAWKNGYWNILLTRRGSRGFQLRHYVPMMFVLVLVLLLSLSIFSSAALYALLALLALYIALALAASLQICIRRQWLWQFFPLPLWFFMLHFTYGLASLSGFFTSANKFSRPVT